MSFKDNAAFADLVAEKTRIHGPINNTLRAEYTKLKIDYPGSWSDFFLTLMLRIDYPTDFQSKYELKIKPQNEETSLIDNRLEPDAAKFWKNVLSKFKSIEHALDYIINQQKVQYPRELKDKVIYDLNDFEY